MATPRLAIVLCKVLESGDIVRTGSPCLKRPIRRAVARTTFLCCEPYHDQARVVCHHYHPPGILKQAYRPIQDPGSYGLRSVPWIYGSVQTRFEMEFKIWQALSLMLLTSMVSAQSLSITPTNTTSDPEYHASGIQLGIYHSPTASPIADFLVAALTQTAGTNIPVRLGVVLTLYRSPPALPCTTAFSDNLAAYKVGIRLAMKR